MEKSIVLGLQNLSKQCTQNTENTVNKIHIMQNDYLSRNNKTYTIEEHKQINYYFKATLYKFHLAGMSLEQLWSLSSLKRNEVYKALENSVEKLDISDNDLNIISFTFESFLFQSKSFLDFMMIFICLILKTNHKGSISKNKFFKALKYQKLARAEKTINYFNDHVFGSDDFHGLFPNNWGTLLSDLRDKVAHRDKIRPSFKSSETLLDNILFNWPTLHNLTYDRFYQYIQNGMFGLFTDVFPIILNLEWPSDEVVYNLKVNK